MERLKARPHAGLSGSCVENTRQSSDFGRKRLTRVPGELAWRARTKQGASAWLGAWESAPGNEACSRAMVPLVLGVRWRAEELVLHARYMLDEMSHPALIKNLPQLDLE